MTSKFLLAAALKEALLGNTGAATRLFLSAVDEDDVLSVYSELEAPRPKHSSLIKEDLASILIERKLAFSREPTSEVEAGLLESTRSYTQLVEEVCNYVMEESYSNILTVYQHRESATRLSLRPPSSAFLQNPVRRILCFKPEEVQGFLHGKDPIVLNSREFTSWTTAFRGNAANKLPVMLKINYKERTGYSGPLIMVDLVLHKISFKNVVLYVPDFCERALREYHVLNSELVESQRYIVEPMVEKLKRVNDNYKAEQEVILLGNGGITSFKINDPCVRSVFTLP